MCAPNFSSTGRTVGQHMEIRRPSFTFYINMVLSIEVQNDNYLQPYIEFSDPYEVTFHPPFGPGAVVLKPVP